MAITRKSVADALDEYDDQISDLQDGKRETLQDYRAQLADSGMGKDEIKVEIEATKAAIKRRRAIREKGEEVVEHKDALVDEIFAEITASRAPRATRVEIIEEFPAGTAEADRLKIEPIPQHDPVTGEILDNENDVRPNDSVNTDDEASHAPSSVSNSDHFADAGKMVDQSTAALKEVRVHGVKRDALAGKPSVPSDLGSQAAAGTQAPPVDTHSADPDPSGVAADSATEASPPVSVATQSRTDVDSSRSADIAHEGDEDRHPIQVPSAADQGRGEDATMASRPATQSPVVAEGLRPTQGTEVGGDGGAEPAREGGSPDSHVAEADDASAAAPLPCEAQHEFYAGGNDARDLSKAGEAVSPLASPVPSFVAKPDGHPINSKGIKKPIGCLHLEVCASGNWRLRCDGCDRKFVHQSEAAE